MRPSVIWITQSLDALPGSGQKADFSVRSILNPSKLAEL